MSAGSIESSSFNKTPLVEVAPTRDQEMIFSPFNPRVIDHDAFSVLPGEVQQVALKYLIRENDTTALSRLRPDFEMNRELDRYEIAIADAIHLRTASSEPITGDLRDTGFSFIHSFVNLSEPDLVRKIESERVRREDNPSSLFYSHEKVGRFSAARRYRRVLELEVQADIVREQQAARELEEARRRSEQVMDRNPKTPIAEIRVQLQFIKDEAE